MTSEKPTFRVAHRLCINCGRDIVFAAPFPDPRATTDDVLDLALEAHPCKPVPRARGVWRARQ
jgi:hypothetical protein